MSDWKIYYNPRCGTCRKTLELLKSNKIEPTIVEYLKTPPTATEIDGILKKLGKEPHEIARAKEAVYDELKLGTTKRSRADWLKILAENPILIERPIVVHGNKAVVARPPEAAKILF